MKILKVESNQFLEYAYILVSWYIYLYRHQIERIFSAKFGPVMLKFKKIDLKLKKIFAGPPTQI